jgi:hypothetical protein
LRHGESGSAQPHSKTLARQMSIHLLFPLTHFLVVPSWVEINLPSEFENAKSITPVGDSSDSLVNGMPLRLQSAMFHSFDD